MNILLDTNALIWLLTEKDGSDFGKVALSEIENSEIVYVSSISILEIRIKTMLGKLHSEKDLLQDISNAGLKELAFTMKHADALLDFPSLVNHDPFDRMLLGQAQKENLMLLTSDKKLLDLGLSFVINARK